MIEFCPINKYDRQWARSLAKLFVRIFVVLALGFGCWMTLWVGFIAVMGLAILPGGNMLFLFTIMLSIVIFTSIALIAVIPTYVFYRREKYISSLSVGILTLVIFVYGGCCVHLNKDMATTDDLIVGLLHSSLETGAKR